MTAPHETRIIKPSEGALSEERPTESLKEKAGQVASRVSGEIRDETAKRAKGFLRGQKQHLAEELHKTAEVFRESSERFQQREQGTAAKYVNQIASQADRFGRYLSERDLDQLAAEIEGVARRSPMLFLVSAFTSGFVMSRFLRRSPVPTEPRYGQTH
jgi:hypothetical protein